MGKRRVVYLDTRQRFWHRNDLLAKICRYSLRLAGLTPQLVVGVLSASIIVLPKLPTSDALADAKLVHA